MSRVVITGSTRGIGRALTERFLEAGWSVVINGRSEESVAGALSELNEAFPECECSGLPGTVSSEADMQALWNVAAGDGPVDVWINNAGLDQSRSMAWELSTDEIITLIQTNIAGCFIGAGVAIRGMSSQGYGIVYGMEGFGSNGMTQPGLAAYGTSKAAVSYMNKALRTELKHAGTGVRAGSILPGMVMTDLLKSGIPDDPTEAGQLLRIYDILADSPETVSRFICKRIVRRRSAKINWLTGAKAGWRFATAFARKGRFSRSLITGNRND